MAVKIYLAGKMGGIPHLEAKRWRDEIKQRLHWGGGSKYAVDVISPTDYFNFSSVKHDNEHEVRMFDLNKVKHSDVIVVRFHPEGSIGADMEIAVADELKIPILGLNEDNIKLHPWQVDVCHRIFTNINDLVEYIEKFYLS